MNQSEKNALAESAKRHGYTPQQVEELLTIFDKQEIKTTARHLLRVTDAYMATASAIQGKDLQSLSHVNTLALQLIDL